MSDIKAINPNNQYILDEFVKYQSFIYSNYSQSNKSSKENYYKLAVIKHVIDIIAKHKKVILNGSQLASIKGIGPKTIARINEIIDTGKLSEIQNKESLIQAISELSKIYGIGPTHASYFYETYNIKTIKDLLKKAEQGVITLTKQMLIGIKYKNTFIDKIPRVLIARLDNYVQDLLYSIDKNFISIICGSYRRGKAFSSDVDILITNKKLINKNDCGLYLKIVIQALDNFIVDKLTESFNTHFQGFASFKNIPNMPNSYDHSLFNINKNVIRLDIIVVPLDNFYPALLHLTGSGSFNQKLRLHANSLNMKLNQYGLFKLDDHKETIIPINSELDIFNALLLKYIPPEQR